MSTNLTTPAAGDPNAAVIATTQVAPVNGGGLTPEVPVNETPEQRYQRLYAPPSPSTPAPVTLPPEFLTTLTALQQEVQALRQSAPQGSSTSTPAPSNIEWVEKIRSGDFEGAQRAITQSVQAAIQPELQRVKQEAYNDATAANAVTTEINRYLQEVRQTNPDIVQFERYLNGPVTERIQLAQAARRINTPADFLREYKAAVADEVVNLRNLGLQFRAAGKDEALTRNSQVLSSTPMTPQQVSNTQVPQNNSQIPQGESNDDYFARRAADGMRRRGLA